MVRVSAMAWMLLMGCSRLNPAFDAARATTGSATTGSDAPPTSASVTNPTSEDATTKTTSESEGDVSTATTRSGSTSSTTDTAGESEESESGGTLCPGHADARIRFTLLDTNGDPVLPSCDDFYISMAGEISVSGDLVEFAQCSDCPCPDPVSDPLGFDFDGSVLIPSLPGCAGVVAWAQDFGGVCDWAGFAVISAAQLPVWVAANTRILPEEVGGGTEIGLVDDVLCTVETCDAAGTMRLAFEDGAIGVGDAPTVVTIGFYAGSPYQVEDLMSFVDPECVEHVAWTAIAAN